MRVWTLLLLLAGAGGAAGRGALVLRAGCRHPAAYSAARLHAHAAAQHRAHLLDNYRLLSYEATCGPAWRATVLREVLTALGGGGGAAGAGWAGAPVCAVLRAAGAPAAPCAAPAARATLLAWLAARLRWRRALLLPAAGGGVGGGECGDTLRAARAQLRKAGVLVHSTPLSDDDHTHIPHVVVACESSRGLPPPPSPDARAALLLLRVASDDEALQMSNITVDLTDSPYIRNDNDSKHSSNEIRGFMNASHDETEAQNRIINITHKIIDLDTRFVFSDTSDKAPLRLLLTDEHIAFPDPPSPSSLYDELLDAIEHNARSRRLGVETVQRTFQLYEWQGRTTWRLVTALATVATRRLDDDEDWVVAVQVTNASDAWQRWHALTDSEEPAASSIVLLVLYVLTGCVCLAVPLSAAARALSRRRRGLRRRGDVVLAAADFSFPAEEPRRLPDGMESMLSCWLQQLHEFGGPELERPDLLQQPPPPSAPSSTASGSRLALDRRTRYKGDPVHLKPLPAPGGALELRRKATDVLLVLHNLRHENLNPFIGCLCSLRPALVWDVCGRGTLEDVLRADDIRLDWTFRLSLLTDLVRGLRHLHGSPLRLHGRLSSRNCLVDSRWVLRLTDYGLPDFYRAQNIAPAARQARDLLWTAPELLRAGPGARPTPAGDVYALGVIMQEVIVRGEPYCMLALSPEEIIEKLIRPPPLIRPSVSMGAAPPEAVSVMRQCWAEAPDARPDTAALADIFRLLHRGRKINIVDSMFEMLEKYSNNLEELIKERTEQLDMEKKKTEQLLNRMLPRTVAERLVLGLRVEPEEFEEVSIYFSDIVGFTALAASSSPVQVVALLNDLYTTFDAAIEQYNVYKVETIGDAYMVVGGLPVRHGAHAQSVATMALHLLHLAGRFRVRHLPARPLHLRIGLHTGPCCAGVVGLTMPRYCLFGDTVNTASRMESTGAAWRIQISSATAAKLEAAGGYRLRSRGLTQIKGKGAMHTYWLLGKDGFDKPLPTPPPLPTEETLVEHEAEGEAELAHEEPPPPADRDEFTPAPPPDKFAWQRSGAVSADSSPPAAPYSRYRCRGGGGGGAGGGRTLRRQWSLERGEALAAARASSPPSHPRGPPLLPPATARPHRYRTRPDPEAPVASASFD